MQRVVAGGLRYDESEGPPEVANTAATLKYSEYDAMGRVKESSQAFASGSPYAFKYDYNHVGLTSATYPSGRKVDYAYDGWRLSTERSFAPAMVTSHASPACAGGTPWHRHYSPQVRKKA